MYQFSEMLTVLENYADRVISGKLRKMLEKLWEIDKVARSCRKWKNLQYRIQLYCALDHMLQKQ